MNHDVRASSEHSELLTVPEAARVLRISRNLAYELVARHELPAIRLGRVIRIPRSQLHAWVIAKSTEDDRQMELDFNRG